MTMVTAGRMRHRVNIQTAAESRDAQGGVSRSWTTAAIRWAQIEPLRGRELFDDQQVQSDLTHRVRMRFYDGLTTSNRIQFGTRVLNIKQIINPAELKAELELMCTEVV